MVKSLMQLETDIQLLNELLTPWEQKIGSAFPGYKNHVTRMLNFCFYLAQPSEEEKTKLIIAAAFHDIGIWSHGTVDYLDPSVDVAMDYLKENDLIDWSEEVALMISEHHKLRAVDEPRYPLVEIFRTADLVDFSLGMIKKGVPKNVIASVRSSLPNEGFHKNLMRLSWGQFKKEPLNQVPMIKL